MDDRLADTKDKIDIKLAAVAKSPIVTVRALRRVSLKVMEGGLHGWSLQ